jgi:hypothetical protein
MNKDDDDDNGVVDGDDYDENVLIRTVKMVCCFVLYLGTPFLIVTEFMENGSLDKYLKV